jgi:hypothetical protein
MTTRCRVGLHDGRRAAVVAAAAAGCHHPRVHVCCCCCCYYAVLTRIPLMYTGDASSWTEARVRVLAITPIPHGGCNITMQQPGNSSHFTAPFPFEFPDAILRLLPGEEPRLRAGRHVPARRGQHVLSAGCRHTRRALLQRAQPHDVQRCCRTILQRLQPLHTHSGLSPSLASGSTSRCPVKSYLKSTRACRCCRSFLLHREKEERMRRQRQCRT